MIFCFVKDMLINFMLPTHSLLKYVSRCYLSLLQSNYNLICTDGDFAFVAPDVYRAVACVSEEPRSSTSTENQETGIYIIYYVPYYSAFLM